MLHQKKQKILQISHGYNAPFLDVANMYARLFDSEHFEVTSLFLKGQKNDSVTRQVVTDRQIYLDCSSRNLRGLKIKALLSLIRILRENNYCLVIAHRYKSIYLACLASFFVSGCPSLIGVVHAYNVFRSLPRKILVSLRARQLKLLGVSQSIRENIASDLAAIAFKEVFSMPNCIDVGKLQGCQANRKEARKKLGIKNGAFVIATAGRLHPEKDQETLIRAFAQVADKMPGAILIIFGSGPLHEELQTLITDLQMGNKVELGAFIPSLSKYYGAFDLFVLPSKIEPFGMVLIEAMSAGVPVLSSKTGGGTEIVGEEELLFEIGDIDGLKIKLVEAFQWSNTKRQHLTDQASQRLYTFFSQEAFNKKFWSLPFNNHP